MNRTVRNSLHLSAFLITFTSLRIAVLPCPAEIPFEIMVLRLYFSDMNHFGAGICLLVIVGNSNRIEFTNRIIPRRIQLGYFQVIAEPVSTCVHDIFELSPLQIPLLVTKL
jgi:hypothetical protein